MSTAPSNLNCILLNASGAAYNIAPGACIYTPDTIYSPHVPYTSGPQAACGGPFYINAATVGQCLFGIVVAFRGTLPPSTKDPDSWLDWLQDFFAVPVSVPSLPGQVHSGFYNATATIIQKVQTLVLGYNPGPDNPVYVTGHSKGGPMASMAAYILSQSMNVPNVQPVVTFASARPGDPAFRAGYEAVFQQTRYENYDDIVPLMPPSLDFIQSLRSKPMLFFGATGQRLQHMLQSAADWDYVPVGNMRFVTKAHQVIDNESVAEQTADVILEFVEDVMKRDFSSFGDAHSLLPGRGYNSGVCG